MAKTKKMNASPQVTQPQPVPDVVNDKTEQKPSVKKWILKIDMMRNGKIIPEGQPLPGDVGMAEIVRLKEKGLIE
jgi:hypothetical protein